jgi:hypothetical protein
MVDNRHVQYAKWLFASTPETIRGRVPEDQLRHDLDVYFDGVWVERVETPEWLAGYARRCPVDGTEPRDYRLREIEVLPDAAVLAGIHFRNRDVNRPFVGVFAQSRDLTDAEMEVATSALSGIFSRFKPRAVHWWAPEHRSLSDLPNVIRDQRLVVGRIQDVTSGSPPALLPERFSFEAEPDIPCYPDYLQAYAEFTARATFQDAPRPERLATLEECASHGALYCLRDGGRFAGVMAARPNVLRGIRGWEVVEEILDSGYRGKGLAVTMQRLFVSRLNPELGALVMGEIVDGNLPSLRTAQRVGRKDVGGWCSIPNLWI